MTKFLSQTLQAKEPAFRQQVERLELANGNPNADIRLTTEIMRQTRVLLPELGLDPHDTTPQELYHALGERLKKDELIVQRTLQTQAASYISAEADAMAGLAHVLRASTDSRRGYAIKASSLKALFKKQPPKKTMKQLGYRSLESFLKHESAVAILAAAKLVEDAAWQHKFINRYGALQPRDFEERSIMIEFAAFKRWQSLSDHIAEQHKHTVVAMPELGALMLLPLPHDAPAGSVIASLALALQGLNEIRAAGTYLKVQQVRADYGAAVIAVASGEATLLSEVAGQSVPWRLVQRFYARSNEHFSRDIFEPYIEAADMVWHDIEASARAIEPKLAFWQRSSHVGLVYDGKAVSCNMLDVAINVCNKVPFENRVSEQLQHSVWHELLLRYLQPKHVEATVWESIKPEFAPAAAVN